MSDRRRVFPLRFRRPDLRDFVRELADRESISQNEFIEQAVEHEIVLRGALLARDLEDAANRLREASDAQLEALIDRSVEEFGRGEGQRDPFEAHQITRRPGTRAALPARLDAVAAFRDVTA